MTGASARVSSNGAIMPQPTQSTGHVCLPSRLLHRVTNLDTRSSDEASKSASLTDINAARRRSMRVPRSIGLSFPSRFTLGHIVSGVETRVRQMIYFSRCPTEVVQRRLFRGRTLKEGSRMARAALGESVGLLMSRFRT